MNHPWLTTTDWPVSAFDGNAARNTATSATSCFPSQTARPCSPVCSASLSPPAAAAGCVGLVRTLRTSECYDGDGAESLPHQAAESQNPSEPWKARTASGLRRPFSGGLKSGAQKRCRPEQRLPQSSDSSAG